VYNADETTLIQDSISGSSTDSVHSEDSADDEMEDPYDNLKKKQLSPIT
jgi:hypothetical protein